MTWITIKGDLSTDECDTGCWVDGHWGQYGGDHLADKIDHMFNIEPLDDPRVLRLIAESTDEMGYTNAAASWWEIRSEAIDKLTDRLNEATPEGFVWDWVDGEFFLMESCGDEENCDNEECAHWRYA